MKPISYTKEKMIIGLILLGIYSAFSLGLAIGMEAKAPILEAESQGHLFTNLAN